MVEPPPSKLFVDQKLRTIQFSPPGGVAGSIKAPKRMLSVWHVLQLNWLEQMLECMLKRDMNHSLPERDCVHTRKGTVMALLTRPPLPVAARPLFAKVGTRCRRSRID